VASSFDVSVRIYNLHSSFPPCRQFHLRSYIFLDAKQNLNKMTCCIRVSCLCGWLMGPCVAAGVIQISESRVVLDL
jgi:hypothetical protein